MNDFEKLGRAKVLLLEALGASVGNSSKLLEVRSHIRSALSKLDEEAKKHARRFKSEQQFVEQWGDNIAAMPPQKTPVAPMTQEAYNKTLAQLNKLIDQEKATLEALENNSAAQDVIQE